MKSLKALMESSLLNEETKTVLQEAWDTAVAENKSSLEIEYAEKFNEAKSELNSSVMDLVNEAVADELTAISQELAEARSLELIYAEKLQHFKEQYAVKTEETIEGMVAESVKAELDELKEDIDYAKKHQFALSMFESFRDTYERMFGESDIDIHKQLEEATNELNVFRRERIMNSLLESVSGEKRGVVETILEGVATEKLEAKFETLKPIILAENDDKAEGDVITESDNGGESVEGTIVIENDDKEKTPVNEGIDPAIMARIQKSVRFGSR